MGPVFRCIGEQLGSLEILGEPVQMIVISHSPLFLHAAKTAKQAFIPQGQGLPDHPLDQLLLKQALGTKRQGFPAGVRHPNHKNHQEEQTHDGNEQQIHTHTRKGEHHEIRTGHHCTPSLVTLHSAFQLACHLC